jgi:hypothetical protein
VKRGAIAFGVGLATAIGVAACGGTTTATKTVTVAGTAPVGVGRPRELVLYGRVASLARRDGHFELRFDPAWFLSGSAAEHAAVEDKVLSPGQPVPNDNYVVDEGHRLLRFVVSPTARARIVTRGPTTTAVAVPELAQILAGKNPRHRPLFVPGNHLGFWIRVGDKYPNPVIALDQQYHP